MKKAFLLLLSAVMLLGFASCGRVVPSETTVPSESENTCEPSPASQDTESPQASGTKLPVDLLFWDDFQDGNTDGWQISANWDVQQDGDTYAFATSGEGTAYVPGGLCWESGYALRAVYLLESGCIAFNFDATTAGRYFVQITEDQINLNKEDSTGVDLLASADAPEPGAHYIAAGMQDGCIQVYIDKELLLYADDPEPISGGTIMLGATEGTQAWVDNVVVHEILGTLKNPETPMPEPEPEPEAESDMGLVIADLPDEEEDIPDIPDDNVPEIIPGPEISFNVSSSTQPASDSITVEAGEDVMVTWAVINASCVYLDNEVVDMQGQIFYTPQTTTGMVLGVVALDGTLVERSIMINVNQPEIVMIGKEGPDLRIKGVGYKGMKAGSPTTVNVTVVNAGDTACGAFSVEWFPYDAEVVGLCWEVDGLAPGEELKLTDEYPGYPQSGTYTYTAVADREDEIAESDDSNNKKSGDLTIN